MLPSPRYLQASALVDARFYFFGGYTSINSSFTNEVWYLDLSDITTTSWHKDADMPVEYVLGSACVSPIDNSTVLLVGGKMNTPNGHSNSSEINIFNSNNSQWKRPKVRLSNIATARIDISVVSKNDGKIFILGGISPDSAAWYDDMIIFDFTVMAWSKVSQLNGLKYADYTATLLPTGLIIYIGGRYNGKNTLAKMDNILIFDTKSSSWSNKIASGVSIGSRVGHSAVLTLNGSIIIYGGTSDDSNLGPQVLPDIAVLDVNSWAWSNPKISQTNAPPSLTFHSAALYGNYMIITFGRITSTFAVKSNNMTLNNNIYILDTQNYTWINTTKNTSEKGKFNYILLFGIGALLVAFSLVVVLIYKFKTRRQRQFKKTNSIHDTLNDERI
ncbi:galactose oxidase [Gigaspora margarita]|nr:galactose oxidase [Gigaspora margarita]